MVALSALKVGDVLFSCARQKQGNTNVRKTVCWRVYVSEVHENHCIASWNGNAPRRYSAYDVRAWRRTPVKDRFA